MLDVDGRIAYPASLELRLETHLAGGLAEVKDKASPHGARGLTYPFDGVPALGEAIQVAPGVLWMRLPLPLALNHINVYAIEDGEGWTLIDTGLGLDATRAQWEVLFAGPLQGRPVTRLICTHMHPDHLGLAGWLCERFQAPLVMTRLEYVTARMLVSETGSPAPEAAAAFYRSAGWSEAQLDAWRREFGGFGRAVSPLPRHFTRICEGDRVRIGDHDWRVVVGEGHSPEHACLWREADDVILGGDQILPRISSNISVWPTEPLADPLGDWLVSLERMKAVLPEQALVLPSHGEPFRGVHTRLDALIRGHRTALTRLERTLKTPSRVVDVFGALFARPVNDGVLGMATGEAVAHLNYLLLQGRAERSRDAEGVDWWTLIDKDET